MRQQAPICAQRAEICSAPSSERSLRSRAIVHLPCQHTLSAPPPRVSPHFGRYSRLSVAVKMPPRKRTTARVTATAPDANAAAVAAEARGADISGLPPDELGAVFRFLTGDVESLCRAARVSHAWLDAAREPSLWRVLRFSEHPDLAHRLTDARLEWLVKRAGAALECLDLSGSCGDSSVSLRGVLRALRAAPPLVQLCVRGVRYGPRSSRSVLRYEELRSLMRPVGGLLDAAETAEQRLALCEADGEDGAPCWRLCGAEDELCVECNLFHCSTCLLAARAERFPPCEHLCDTCLKPDDDAFFHCERCEDDEVNGHCADCMTMCADCNKLLCDKCTFSTSGGMTMCRAGSCDFQSYDMFCDECIFPADLDHPRKLSFCYGCEDMICDDCMDLQTRSICAECDEIFCRRCRDACLTAVGSGSDSDEYDEHEQQMLCAKCKKGC